MNPTPSQIIEKSNATDWRKLDPEKTLYLALESGRVVMELSPDFAPLHVENIKKMARSGYWDGLAILRSQDNYVVSWGDPGNMAKPPKAKAFQKGIAKSLQPEFERSFSGLKDIFELIDGDVYADNVGFYKSQPIGWNDQKSASWLLHCYGAVGVARGEALNSGSGSALYVVTGHGPRHLDRNITLVGQVVHGIENLSSLPRGTEDMGFYSKASLYPKILSVKVEADIPVSKRIPLEILKTKSEIFKDYTEARRNRSEKWFHRPAGKIEVCNARPLVRLKKAVSK